VSLVIDVDSEGVRTPLGRSRVADIVRSVLESERVRDALISIAFVSRRAIAALNRKHLRRNRPTDVIAFGLTRSDPRTPVIGDVYIAPEVAREQAIEHGVPIREELARLVVHGTLHVLGHDHPDGNDRTTSPMWQRQEKLLVKALAGSRR
jgi:probable rRNA maturation factor